MQGRQPADPSSLRRRALAFLLLGCCALLGACDANVHDGVGPRVPVPNLLGRVLRSGVAASGLRVELRGAEDAVVFAQSRSAADGSFDFVDVPAGDWDLKISGGQPGDYDSISWIFALAETPDMEILPDLDIFAYGAETLAPEDGASVPPPSFIQPLTFSWLLPEGGVSTARVNLYDEGGSPVWSSPKNPTDSITWNGIASEGDYANHPVPAGNYSWRVKLQLDGDLEARLAYRRLEFLAPAARGEGVLHGSP